MKYMRVRGHYVPPAPLTAHAPLAAHPASTRAIATACALLALAVVSALCEARGLSLVMPLQRTGAVASCCVGRAVDGAAEPPAAAEDVYDEDYEAPRRRQRQAGRQAEARRRRRLRRADRSPPPPQPACVGICASPSPEAAAAAAVAPIVAPPHQPVPVTRPPSWSPTGSPSLPPSTPAPSTSPMGSASASASRPPPPSPSSVADVGEPLPPTPAPTAPVISEAAARRKLQWAWECMGGAARANPAYRLPAPADLPLSLGAAADPDGLRHHAFTLHASVASLFTDVPVMRYSGHAGPWIENAWIAHFAGAPHVRNVSLNWWADWRARHGDVPPGVTQLAVDPVRGVVTIAEPYDFDLFYPLVPLFGRWEDFYFQQHAAGTARSAAERLGVALQHRLRTDVAYVTVTQRFSGFLPHSSSYGHRFRNVLVLASGGGGHVALPLLAGEVPPVDLPVDRSRPRLKLSFMGKAHHHPARERMLSAVAGAGLTAHGRPNPALAPWLPGVDYLTGYQEPPPAPPPEDGRGSPLVAPAPPASSGDGGGWGDWREVMARSELTLAPRGTGPTSFRLYEALQAGSVPVYIHDGHPWLPYYWPAGHTGRLGYRSLPSLSVPALDWGSLAFLVHIDDFDGWLRETVPLLLSEPGRLDGMRAAARALRESHFTLPGIMGQLRGWLLDADASQLRCTAAL